MHQNIAVFCASHLGHNPLFQSTAQTLGQLIALNGHTLVYGGSNCGYMGTVSTAAIESGGHVVGIIPTFFSDEIIHSQPRAEICLVASMQERKALMLEMSDAFIALPGGVGTLDEISEVLMSNQLKLTHKPIGLLNVDGYYNPLLQQFERMIQDGVLSNESINLLIVDDNPEALLKKLDNYPL